ERGEPFARGDGEDRVVEVEVLAHEAAQVLGGAERLEALAAPPQLLELARRDPLRGAAGRVALEQRAQLVEVLDVLRVVDADGGAAVRRRDDEVLGLEDQERLAHRRAADAELARELLLLEPLAWREPALDDRLADELGRGGAGISNEHLVREQHPRHGANHTGPDLLCMQSVRHAPGSVRGSDAATRAPAAARAAVAAQNASQPACAASAPSGGVQTPETTNTTVAATAKERPASSAGARSPALT